MRKKDVITPIQRERDRMLALAGRLDEGRIAEPLTGGWSVRDVVAHCVYWQGMLARMMGAPLPPPTWIPRWQSEHDVGQDELNRLTVDHYRAIPLATLLADFSFTADVVCKIVEEMKEENLLLPAGEPWEKGVTVWQAIAGESSAHCKQHTDAIERELRSSEDPAVPVRASPKERSGYPRPEGATDIE